MPIQKYIYVKNEGSTVNRAYTYQKDETGRSIPVGSVVIKHGVNILKADEFDAVKKDLKQKFEDKEYKILHKDADSKSNYEVSVDFEKLTLKQAEDLVESIYSIFTLEDLKSKEFRDSVRAKIANRLDALKDPTARIEKKKVGSR